MKLKFINLLLAVVLLIGSTQILTSCKDTNEDLYANLDQTLSQRIADNKAALEQLQAQLTTMQENCPNKCLEAVKKYLNDNGYTTKGDVNILISNALQNYYTKAETYTQTEVINKINELIAAYMASGDFEDAIEQCFANAKPEDGLVQAIWTALATEGYVPATGLSEEEINKLIDAAIKNLPSTGSGLSKEEITALVNEILDGKDYVTRDELRSAIYEALSNYYTKEEVDAIKTNIENTLNSYVLKSDLDNLIAAYLKANEEYQKMVNITKQLEDAMAALNGDYSNVSDFFTFVESTLLTVKSDLADLKTDLEARVATLEANYSTLSTAVGENTANIETLTGDVATMKEQITTLNAFMNEWSSVLPTIQQQALDAYNKAQENATAIADLNTLISEIQGDVTVLKTDVTTLKTDVATAQQTANEALTKAEENLTKANEYTDAQVAALKGGYEGTLQDLYDLISDNASDIADLNEAVAANAEEISKITEKLNDIYSILGNYDKKIQNLENRVSSIVLQGVQNPILGYLNTPFGISSNVLLAYVGENTQPMAVTFPSTRGSFEYDSQQIIKDSDLYTLIKECGLQTETIASGEILANDYDGNLGTVYLTINPANIDLEGKTFSVVNSLGNETPVKLVNLRPSSKELTFGYSRTATSPNGFYEAAATVAKEDLNKIRVYLDQEVKSAASEVLKDRKPSDILALGNAIYNQLDGLLPALGIQAAWQEEGTNYAVTSQYGIAATSFHPLSYAFLYGKSFRNISLPTLGDLDFTLSTSGINIDLGEFNLDIDIDGIVSKLKINIDCEINTDGLEDKLVVKVDKFPTGATVNDDSTVTFDYEPREFYVDNIDDVIDTIQSSLQNSFNAIQPQVQEAFKEALESLQSDIKGAIDSMLANVQQTVNNSLESVIKDLQSQINDKVDDLVGKFTNSNIAKQLERILNRVNGVLSDPNHYLQATLLFNNGGSYGMVSNTKAMPTIFTGSGNAVMLVPTTYTGEVATPAYKKFVAVTNVYSVTDKSKSAQAADPTCLKLLKQANAQQYINEVVPGTRRTIPFCFEGGAGYIYEIVYQALDYSGVTSTQKFYVRVK